MDVKISVFQKFSSTFVESTAGMQKLRLCIASGRLWARHSLISACPCSPKRIRCCTSEAAPNSASRSPWLLVGLGNPGSKYEGTRHNVGFEMIDAISRAEGIPLSTIQFKALLGKGHIGSSPVLLAKPQTYVNLSGESVKPLAAYYKIPAHHVLTIYDDLDLEFALMRLLPKGGHGGHNGMRSIIEQFGTRSTPRLRFGYFPVWEAIQALQPFTVIDIPCKLTLQSIGRPPGIMDVRAFVLQKFSSSERKELNFALERGVEAVRLTTCESLEKAISTWNVPKSKDRSATFSN